MTAAFDAAKTEKDRNLNNIVCGPRSVQFVLKQFGHDVELVDLVREMQWPQLTDGASAASVIAALEKRGVFVKVIKVDPKAAVFAWNHPMILHLKPDVNESHGHFVVSMPRSTDEQVTLFDGLAGYYSGPYSEFRRKMSGIVIVCSPTPNADDAVIVYRRVVIWTWCIVLVVLVLAITLLRRCYARC